MGVHQIIFGYMAKKWTFDIRLIASLSELGFGGGFKISPTGDHPYVIATLTLLFMSLRTTFILCAHQDEHAEFMKDFDARR